MSEKAKGELLALVALCFYVATELLFRYGALAETVKLPAGLDTLFVCDSVAIGLAVGAIAMRPRSLRPWQIALGIVTLFVLLFSASRTGDYRLVHGILLLIAVAGIDMDKICLAYCATSICAVLLVFLLSMCGFVYIGATTHGLALAFDFGFRHAGTCGALLFSIVGAMAYLSWNKPTWWVPLVLALLSAVFSYCMLHSSVSAAVLVLLAIVILAGRAMRRLQVARRSSRVLVVAAITIPALLVVTMLACAAFFTPSNFLFGLVDTLTNHHASYVHNYYSSIGAFTHLGRPFSQSYLYLDGVPYAVLDSGYCFVALVYGLLVLYALAAVYITSVLKVLRGDRGFCICAYLVICSLYMMVSSCLLYLPLSFAALFLASAFEGPLNPLPVSEDGCQEKPPLHVADPDEG